MSETDEIAAWLRKQAEDDIAAAGAATGGPWILAAGRQWLDNNVVFGEGSWPGHIQQVCNVDYAADKQGNLTHISRHDPLTETARAASVLAVLSEYADTVAVKERAEAKMRAGEDPGPDAGYLEALAELAVYGSVIRRLARGYRSREGWKKAWA